MKEKKLNLSLQFHRSYGDEIINSDKCQEIIRCILAMSNNRDGGFIILGVEKAGENYKLKGMKKDDIETYEQDRIFEQIRNYGNPEPKFKIKNIEFDDKNFIVFQIESFSFTPIICNDPRNKLSKLSHTSIYIRTDKPEDKKITEPIELKEIIDLAITKEFEKWSPRIQSLTSDLFNRINKENNSTVLNTDLFKKEIEDIKKIV